MIDKFIEIGFYKSKSKDNIHGDESYHFYEYHPKYFNAKYFGLTVKRRNGLIKMYSVFVYCNQINYMSYSLFELICPSEEEIQDYISRFFQIESRSVKLSKILD